MICLKSSGRSRPDVRRVHLRAGLVDPRRQVGARPGRIANASWMSGGAACPHRIGDRAIADPVVAAADLCRRPLHLHLLLVGQREEVDRALARRGDEILRNAVPGHHEEAGVPCRPRRSGAPPRASPHRCRFAAASGRLWGSHFPPPWCTLSSRAGQIVARLYLRRCRRNGTTMQGIHSGSPMTSYPCRRINRRDAIGSLLAQRAGAVCSRRMSCARRRLSQSHHPHRRAGGAGRRRRHLRPPDRG